MKKVFAVTAALALLGLGIAAQAAITIDTVAVGDKGNAADTRVMDDGTTGYGSVGYAYNIGKYEVTAAQYCDFLNHKAKADPYGLYSSWMWSAPHGYRIERTGSSDSYSYSANSPDMPISRWSGTSVCRTKLCARPRARTRHLLPSIITRFSAASHADGRAHPCAGPSFARVHAHGRAVSPQHNYQVFSRPTLSSPKCHANTT